jgi:hypothetical protein
VQAQRGLAALQGRDEQAAPLDLLEPLAARESALTSAQRPAVSSSSTEQRSRKQRSGTGSSPRTSLSR